MILRLWYYLRGYVIVEVSGNGISKFLNFMLHHNITMWDVVRKGDSLYFKTYIPTFKNIRPYLRKSNCKAKINKKVGIPFILNKYRKRKIFASGIAIFLIIVWVLSSYIWLVDVEGTVRLNKDDIVESLELQGYKTGERKSKMDLREAEKYLLKKYPDIVWTGITYEGTRMVVRVAESIPKPIMNEKDETPTTIVSKKDALITYIATSKGQPVVKVGDVVKKGDPLIKGEMPIGAEDETLYYTSSKGVIKGKTVYTATSSASLIEEKKQYLESESKHWIFEFFGTDITLHDGSYLDGNFDVNTKFHQLSITKNFPLPIGIKVETRTPYKKTYYNIPVEQAKMKIYNKLCEEVESKLSSEAKVLNKEIIYKQDGKIINGTLEITVEEEIGYNLDVTKANDLIAKGE